MTAGINARTGGGQRTRQTTNRAQQATATSNTTPNTATSPSVFDALRLNEEQQKMLQALRRAFQDDLNQQVFANTKILEDLAQKYNLQTDLTNHTPGSPFLFTNKKTGRTLAVTKDSIEFVGKPGRLWGTDKKFTYAAALEMAEFAALDLDMQAEGGVELTGNRHERALLERAIIEVNKSLPQDQQIKVKNKMPWYWRPSKGPIEQEAKKHAKKMPTNFKRESPLAIPTATAAAAATATPPTNNGQAAQQQSTTPTHPLETTPSVLSNAEIDASFQQVVEHVQNGNSRITREDFRNIFDAIGFSGNRDRAYRELSRALDSMNATELRPGHGRVFTESFRTQYSPVFNSSANPDGQPQQNLDVVQRGLNTLRATMARLRASSPEPVAGMPA